MSKHGYCKLEDGEYVELGESCIGCDQLNCKNRIEADDVLEKFRSSELAMDITRQLSLVFGTSDAEVVKKLDSVFVGLQETCNMHMTTMVNDAVRCRVATEMEGKLGAFLDGIFGEAMAERILAIDKKDVAKVTTIQKMASEKIKEYIQNQDRGNNRNRNAGSLEEALEKMVGKRVDIAVKELTEEAINKFNKEAMKKMMAGMATAIQNDKRLLAVLCD